MPAPSATEFPVTLDASGNLHPLAVNGLPVNLPLGTTLNGSPINGVSDGDKGDITVSNSGATWTIDNVTITLAKMANMATASLIYRKTAGSGAPEVNSLATLKTDLGLMGTNSGDQDLSGYQTKAGVLALGGFSSITGRIGSATMPLGAQLYDNAGTPKLIIDVGAKKIYRDDGSTVFMDWHGSTTDINGEIHTNGNPIDLGDGNLLAGAGYVQGFELKAGLFGVAVGTISASGLSANRTFQLPDASGTFLLTTGSAANLTSFPTLNQNTTGSAASLSISGQTGLLTVTGLASTSRIKTVRDAADTILELGGSYSVANFPARQLIASDASTVTVDWSDPNEFVIMGGSLTSRIDGGGQMAAGSISWDGNGVLTAVDFVGDIKPPQIYDGETNVVGNNVGGQWRWSSSDLATYFDNSGFHGDGSALSGIVIVGVTDGSNAAAGNVGEYISSSRVVGSATALTTATPKTVTSISLTAGDWDVTAIGALTGASTGTEFDVAIGTTTNSLTGTVLGDSRCQTPTVSLTGADASLMIPAFRVSIASTTTYYLIVQETFTVGTPSAYGRISARRIR